MCSQTCKHSKKTCTSWKPVWRVDAIDEEILTTYGELQAAFEHAGGYDYDLVSSKPCKA